MGYAATVSAAATPAVVTVSPTVVGLTASYTIAYTAGNTLSIGQYISISFPADTYVSCGSCGNTIPRDTILVNGRVLASEAIGNNISKTIMMASPVAIAAGSPVTIEITKAARLMNPTTPGTYTLSVSTATDSAVLSTPFVIEVSKVSGVSATIDNPIAGEESGYRISFRTGGLGALDNQQVFIRFPEGTKLPVAVSPNDIRVNDRPGTSPKVVDNNVLSIGTSVGALTPVTVIIAAKAHIVSPSIAGRYTVSVYTEVDKIPVDSTPFDIRETPSVGTRYIVSPFAPDGQNGWYITQPLLVLAPVSTAGGSAVARYRVDGGDWQTYSVPILVPDGVHIVGFMSIDSVSGLSESERTLEFKVSSAVPHILLEGIPSTGGVSRASTMQLRGTCVSSAPVELWFGDRSLRINDNGTFQTDLALVEGLNAFQLRASDQAGNVAALPFSVTLDSVAPSLSVKSPLAFSRFTDTSVTVQGTAEVGARLTVQGLEVTQDPTTGVFSRDVVLEKEGLNVVSVVVLDAAGNKRQVDLILYYDKKPVVQQREISLTIGNPVALVDGMERSLDAPPYIDSLSGRTLVPVRFISEALGAVVTWDPALRSVSISLGGKTIVIRINSLTAIVGGRSLPLEQPPVIVGGRTMVPLRFIAEAMGATVDWQSAERRIIIRMML
jgi:hypothetical protein